jgi:hypothetical protein
MSDVLTKADRHRLAHEWWSGTLQVGHDVTLESGREARVSAMAISPGMPPTLTLRIEPASVITISIPMPVPS